MSKLVIQDDEGKTTVVPLIREEITIGRKEGNTIRLTERNVSRRHARILRANGSVNIEDLNSYNGVRVNGSRIQGRCQLSVADRIQIGDYLIELKAEGDEAAAAQEQRTQPIERIDPMAATPVPAAAPIGAVPTAVVNVSQLQGMPAGAPAATAAAGLADTDPGGAAVSAMASPEGFARMVILSTNFAGREYDLNKPAMVIGRTDDNDIIVDHRSISRHHAKIVRENGRYAIVDLQSSNGVRVNGEEYGKVELRRGDVVDLGHVRMRFVDVGEDFLFGRDAHAVDISGKRGKGMWIAIIGAVLLAGIIIAVVAGGGGDDKKTGDTAANNADKTNKTGGGDTTSDETAKTKPGKIVEDDTKTAPDSAVAAKLKAAQDALSNDKWAAAAAAAQKVLDDDADNAEAKKIQDQAKREMAAELRFRDLKKAAKKRQYQSVAKLFTQFDAESVYHDKARDVHDAVKRDYISKQTATANRLAKASKCVDLRKLATRVGKVWEEAGDAVSAVECGEKVAAIDKPKKRDRPKNDDSAAKKKRDKAKKAAAAAAAAAAKKKAAKAPTSNKSASELVTEAKLAARKSQFGKALRLCRQAMSKGGGTQARMVCAIAACNLKNKSAAKRYIKGLGGGAKGMARQICLRNGVNVD